jgi:hypothetical protein
MSRYAHIQRRALSVFRQRDAVRKLAALTGLFALLAQIWIPALCCRAYASDRVLSMRLGGAICHVGLGQHRAVGGQTDEAPQPAGKSLACPVCLAIHAGGASILSSLLGVALVLTTTLIIRCRPMSSQVAQVATVVAYSRGPPLSA